MKLFVGEVVGWLGMDFQLRSFDNDPTAKGVVELIFHVTVRS